MRDRRTLAVAALIAASALCVALLEIRVHETGSSYYRFLIWNLTLAWVPLVLAAIAHARARGGGGILVWVLLVPWLLFFPNAPYLLTDFIHLDEGPAPLWYDALMLSAFAWTALMLGFGSLYLVQTILRRAFGAVIGWVSVLGALALGSVGVFIGRFIRLNSWDALLHPVQVAEVVHDQLRSVPLRTAEALVALTTFLAVGYLVVYGLAELRLDADRDRRGR
jgi:uncharacterized membrane protein